jgi:hypothetical protein
MRRALFAAAAALALGAADAAAQQPTTPPQPTPPAATPPAATPRDTTVPDTASGVPRVAVPRIVARDSAATDGLRVKPGIALIHSILLPGWGQLNAGAPTRAAVYFAGEAANLGMLAKTWLKLADARDRRAARRAAIGDSLNLAAKTDTLLAKRLENPLALDSVVAGDTIFRRLGSLTKARRRQREDWITYTVFWMLASGVDAFVSAQLSDFPGNVGIAPKSDGGVELSWTLPVRRPRWLR